ncbi:autotransporter outer membrane beta-barrel domain-containing protein [Sphingomonas sp. J344]|nr:autotransporter outer membrane beta-barrel domain-containing protein [Sphingomonas sp. J344]MCR5871103.1 autotransporter outer membrane beta-barrel domain-containing protein [Sphingomonas sp. J344]
MTVPADYKAALETLTPEPYAAQRWLGVRATAQFADAVLSCRDSSNDTPLREASCAWILGNDRNFAADATPATVGFREDAQSVSGGVQFKLGDNWVLGAAGGYETGDFVQPNRATGAIERTLLAGTAKYMTGRFVGSFTVAAALGQATTARIVSATVPAISSSSGKFDTYTLRARVAYGLSFGSVTIAPRADFDLSLVRNGPITEAGSGALSLVLPRQSESLFAFTPAIEAGMTLDIGKARIRPLISVGATLFEKAQLSISAALAGAPGGIAPFAASAELNGPLYNFSGGVEVTGMLGAILRLEYTGRFAEGVEEQSASAKLGWRF